jgi:hypothetical protein
MFVYESERMVSTNTVEGFYSIFKRGMEGVSQHCSEKHLHRWETVDVPQTSSSRNRLNRSRASFADGARLSSPLRLSSGFNLIEVQRLALQFTQPTA